MGCRCAPHECTHRTSLRHSHAPFTRWLLVLTRELLGGTLFLACVAYPARGLTGLGLQPKDRVGIWATNCVEWVLLQYACARAGYVLVNVNPAYRSHELAFILRRSSMRALFLREHDSRANYHAILQGARSPDEALGHIVHLGTTEWDNMLANGRDLSPGPVLPGDATNIQYTSGTTGSPKGVVLTHRKLVNNATFHRRRPAHDQRRPNVRSIPALPLCGVRVRRAQLRDPGRDHHFAVGIVRPPDRAGSCPGGKSHRDWRRANDVYCRATTSRVPAVRSQHTS